MKLPETHDVAIVGMACVFPGARNLREFWCNVVRQVDAISDPPDSWEMNVLYEPGTRANSRFYSRRGGYIERPEFDPLAFGVLPKAVDGGEPDPRAYRESKSVRPHACT